MRKMENYKKRNIYFLAVLAAASFCLGGCGRIELPRSREEETLALVDCDSAAVSVSRTFTVPAGQQAVLTADYRQEGGSAGVVLLKGEEEVAALGIPERAALPEEAAAKSGKGTSGEEGSAGSASEDTAPSGHGTVETVLDCGVYTVKVESEAYCGTVKCTLVRKEKNNGF